VPTVRGGFKPLSPRRGAFSNSFLWEYAGKSTDTTNSHTIEAQPGQEVRSQPGTPTWEVAHLYPDQGAWTEEDYLTLDTRRLVEFSHGTLEFLPMPTLSHQDIVLFLRDIVNEHVTRHKLGRVYIAPCPVGVGRGKYREPEKCSS